MNRAPSPRDPWWSDHQRTCGGKYIKIKEPEGYGKKSKGGTKVKDKESAALKDNFINKSKKGDFGKSNSAVKDMKDITNYFGKSISSSGRSTESGSEVSAKRIKLDDEDAGLESSISNNESNLGQKIIPFLGKGYVLGGNEKSYDFKSRSEVFNKEELPSMTRVITNSSGSTSSHHSLDEMRKRWLNYDKTKKETNSRPPRNSHELNERETSTMLHWSQSSCKSPGRDMSMQKEVCEDGNASSAKNLERKFKKRHTSPIKVNTSHSSKEKTSPYKGNTIPELFRKSKIDNGSKQTTSKEVSNSIKINSTGGDLSRLDDVLNSSNLISDQQLSSPEELYTGIRNSNSSGRAQDSGFESLIESDEDMDELNCIKRKFQKDHTDCSSVDSVAINLDSSLIKKTKNTRSKSVLNDSGSIFGSSSRPIEILDSPNSHVATWVSGDPTQRKELVSCPVCCMKVKSTFINVHLDACLR